jgi:tellurite resistance protein TerC
MLLGVDLVHLPTTLSLGVIAAVLTVSVVASLRATRDDDRPVVPAGRDR